MKQIGGLWWPDGDEVAHRVIPANLERAMPLVLPFLRRRGMVVQAGGNVGVYPVALAKHFERVVTLEPDAENFECLTLNIAGLENIDARNAALGREGTTAAVVKSADNIGAHRIALGVGPVEVTTIDELGLTPDLIWLSVNGMPGPVVEGALSTIRRSRPVVIISETHDDTGSARSLLLQHGYRQAGKVPHRDFVMVSEA
ncbi:MAG: FkbM family methyltransferase [Bauldia sp.]|nr:FkbM family methyltransferase [Bauldia sp.]